MEEVNLNILNDCKETPLAFASIKTMESLHLTGGALFENADIDNNEYYKVKKKVDSINSLQNFDVLEIDFAKKRSKIC